MSENTSFYTLRVASGRDGVEASVTGAVYLGAADGDLRLVSATTPFEVSGPARVVSGMLRSADSSVPLRVEVLCGAFGNPPIRVSMAQGRTILLGEHLTRASDRFIRTAP